MLKRVSPKKVKKKKPTITKLKLKLWELCKTITRTRHGNTCYSCRKEGLAGSNWHTGHFIASSVCSTELRYDLGNLRPQCYHCNINLSGNWIAFEEQLLQEMGDKHAATLKKRNQLTKGAMYRDDWYHAKLAEYEAIVKTL